MPPRKQRRPALLPFLLCLLGGATSGAAATPPPYTAGDLQAFQHRAQAEQVAAEPYWRVLLHARRTLTGVASRVDDPKFFLAPAGRTDPAAELQADLAAFFAPAPAAGPAAADRFPARLEWLCGRLGIDRNRLPVPRCRELETSLAEFQPRSVTLVFPTAFMNTPASLFGHTLLKIKGKAASDLLARAANYAAVTHESNGFIFAFKGIVGLYPGYFSLQPYYQKVQEYSDLDQRDLWEYTLNLNAAETRRLLLHTWEMRDIYTDYYFFDENCAFCLLFLIDAARPGLALAENARPWVIPLDTVKQVRAAGLVATCDYRPSRTTRVHYIAGLLDEQRQETAMRIALGLLSPDAALPAADAVTRARTLDLAAEYLQSLRGRQKIAQAEYQARFFAILEARSRLGEPEASHYVVPPPPQPDLGHASNRLTLAVGREAGQNYTEIGWRPAYHDLTDPQDGYLPGAAIEFMNVVLRAGQDIGGEGLTLQRLDLLRLRSFSPVDRFFQPVSWKADVGVLRQRMEDGEWHHVADLGGGAGVTLSPSSLGMLYALAETDAQAGGPDQGWSMGFGGSAGLLRPLGRRWLLDLHVRALGYPLGDQHADTDLGGVLRYTLTANQAVTAELSRRFAWDEAETLAALKWHLFF